MNSALKMTISVIGLVLGLTASGSQAQAGFYYVKFDTVDPGHSPAGQYDWHFVTNSSGGTAGAGPSGLAYDNSHSTQSSYFHSFCVEVNQHISGGSVYGLTTLPNTPTSSQYSFITLETSPTAATNANDIRKMWATYRHNLSATGTAGTNNDKYASFQYAVWTLTGQTAAGKDLNGNSLSGDVLTDYNVYMHNWGSTLADLAVMHNDTYQDQLVELDEGGGGLLRIVPAPPAIVLVLAGVIPCFALRRRLIGKTV